ncbi:DUF418 domain-containing protein [Glycomyces tenuis]|uniref:DUF418 domain-containing protein n=1 Tax=Glycomyces tenuis TaxID=58116 RepID=UPI0004246BCE|nr:DUF418 domain-containing protein [Glycomyces tenuis]
MPVSSTQGTTPAQLGPPSSITKAERSLAPDIARGGMLLFIAIANVAIYVHGSGIDSYGHFTDSTTADHIALFFEKLLAAERSRPMFAILYGFGIAVMASRMFARGMDPKGVRKVLRRRSWWLILFGFIHATFLFFGDILAPYGATGLIALGFVHLSDRALRRWLIGSSVVVVVVSLPIFAWAYSGNSGNTGGTDELSNYAVQMVFGAAVSIGFTTVFTVLGLFVPLVLIGMMLQRSGWIDHPEEHLPGLRKVFVSGMVVNVLSALPVALVGLGVWEPPTFLFVSAMYLTLLGGMYAGLGYICGFALLAHRWRAKSRRGLPGAFAAVGERSLTSYLLQSIIMAPLLSAWGLGVGAHVGYLGAYGIAFGTWAVTVALAVLMDKAGRRGPFEVLLRRLTYGRKRTA